jgi:hypothetical protein
MYVLYCLELEHRSTSTYYQLRVLLLPFSGRSPEPSAPNIKWSCIYPRYYDLAAVDF